MRFLEKEELKCSILEFFNTKSYNDFVINASFISDCLNLYYNTKSDIKNAIVQLDNEQSLLLNDCSLIRYDKPSKIRFDFMFFIHKN